MLGNGREKRLEKGAIFFDKKEVGFILDRKKNPQKIILKKQKDANKLVEEFMLLDNRKVAEYEAWQATQGSQAIDGSTVHE